MDGVIQISSTSFLFTSLLALIIGIVILVAPRTLNYLVAVYFILIGLTGLGSLVL